MSRPRDLSIVMLKQSFSLYSSVQSLFSFKEVYIMSSWSNLNYEVAGSTILLFQSGQFAWNATQTLSS